MWSPSIRSALPILAAAWLAALVACGESNPTIYEGHGVVTAVDVAANKVSLDHGDIPGLMKGMTMGFDVAPGISLAGLEPGTPVDFEVIESNGGYTVTSLVRAAPTEP